MKRYFYESPRGFSNEFSIYAVLPEELVGAERVIDSYDDDPNGRAFWITRREAERLTARERGEERDARRAGQNLYTNPVGATEIVPFGPRLDEILAHEAREREERKMWTEIDAITRG